ncbi:MAG: Omp28-related outer membrane protein [Chitinophagales bacterium]|nr:Omp28-related outer membrane protein [Chitinophagales bacterium]
MKRFNKLLFFGILSVLFFSCSKEEGEYVKIPDNIRISLNKTSIIADGIDEIVVTVKDQDSVDISSTSMIYVDDLPILGNEIYFESTQQGTHKIYANKFGVVSDTLYVTTIAPPPAKYSTKVYAEYFTGNWCGWCPRVDYKLNNFMANNSNLLVVQIHNNDALANRTIDSTLRANFGISSVPTILANRTSLVQENGDIFNLSDSTEFRHFFQKRAVIGLALNTSISGNILSVTAKTGFDANIKDSLKLVVILVEDNVVSPQNNYYNNNTDYPGNPYFNAGDTITNFVHNGVYKSSPTTINGATIPLDKQTKDNEYISNFSLDVTGLNTANLKVIAFVMYADAQKRKGVMNVQWVKAGQNKNYD